MESVFILSVSQLEVLILVLLVFEVDAVLDTRLLCVGGVGIISFVVMVLRRCLNAIV